MLYQFYYIFSKQFGARTPLKAASYSILLDCQACILNHAESALALQVH